MFSELFRFMLSERVVEVMVVCSTIAHLVEGLVRIHTVSALAESKAGPVRKESMPTRLHSVVVVLQLVAYLSFPAIYAVSVAISFFEQPQWMKALALPDLPMSNVVGMGPGSWKALVRECVSLLNLVGWRRLSSPAFEHLGDQFHPIGRREKPRVVQTGPYAYVRHPLYSLVLLRQLVWVIMYWSYIQLFIFAANVAIFAAKIPLEEEAIQRDEKMRDEYLAYMHKVPARVVPHAW